MNKYAYELGQKTAQVKMAAMSADEYQKMVDEHMNTFMRYGIPGALLGGSLGYMAADKLGDSIDMPFSSDFQKGLIRTMGTLGGAGLGMIPGAGYANYKHPVPKLVTSIDPKKD